MTLKETIRGELLDAVSNPARLDEVFRRYGHSKGPLYSALAEATASLTEKFTALCRQSAESEQTYRLKQEQARAIEQKLSSKAQELAALDRKLDQKRELLDQAQALSGLGFKTDELRRLRDLLVQIVASQGLRSEKAVATFFQHVDSYQDIVSVELEVKRAAVALEKAKAEAERWQAEAKAAEARCKARKVSIDLADKLLAQGVKEGDLPQWARILAKAGLAPEGLAQALEQHGSMEVLTRSRQKQANDLKAEAAGLQIQVEALTQERAGVASAIEAIREKGLAEIEQAGTGMLASLKDLEARVQEFGALREQIGDLKAEVALARALRSSDPDLWQAVTSQGVMILLSGAIIWAEVKGFNPELTPPESIQRATFISSFTRVHFADLLRWAAAGLVVEEPTAQSWKRAS